MDQIGIGASELVVGRIGVGAMPWSDSRGFGYGSRLGQSDAQPAFDACVASGVTLVDTAEIYGFGRSERIVGELVRGEARPMVIATKYAPYPWRTTPASIRRALEGSLRRLGVARVDLYQIHFPSLWMRPEVLAQGLADVVEAGLTRHVGVSNFSAAQMRANHAALAARSVPLVSNQVEYSLVHSAPEASGLLDACRELDVTLIAYSPLGRGVLSGKYRPGATPRDMRSRMPIFRAGQLGQLAPLLDALREIGAEHGGRTPSQVALNWLARQPAVLPIPGAKSAEQARQNAESTLFTLTPEQAERLDQLSMPFRRTRRR